MMFKYFLHISVQSHEVIRLEMRLIRFKLPDSICGRDILMESDY